MRGTDFTPSWRELWLLRRNRWLADPGFQRWSMRMPLLRGVAARHATSMFGIITGFVYTKTITAAVDAGIIAALAKAPATTQALADAAGLETGAMARLLGAAQAIDLVEPLPGGRWTLGQRGAALSNNHGALAMIEHHKLFYDDMSDPLAMLRQGGLGRQADSWQSTGQNMPVEGGDLMKVLDGMMGGGAGQAQQGGTGGMGGLLGQVLGGAAPGDAVGGAGGNLGEILAKSGIGQDQLGGLLAQVLPQVVDGMTPGGQVPQDHSNDMISSVLGSVFKSAMGGGSKGGLFG